MHANPRPIARRIVLLAFLLLSVGCTLQSESDRERVLTPLPTAVEPAEEMSLTIVYDNNAYDSRLRTAWGFGCWLQKGEQNLLFDTGGDSAILLGNMKVLGLDPQGIDVVVLSHVHGDHTGGLMGLLATGARPLVYLPASFPAQFKSGLRELVSVHEVDEVQEILPGIYTTGEMGTDLREQGLVIQTSHGLVVVTGCAHPGIVEMVRQARAALDDEVYLVAGGFHLGGASETRIREVCAAFQQLGVRKLAPSHCTGEEAMRILAAEFGDDYVRCGVGWEIDLIP